MNLFKKKKTGLEALKEKLETANAHMIEAQKTMNDFYALLLEVEQKKDGTQETNKQL